MTPGSQSRQVATGKCWIVYLTGFMGAGKSTVGRALAEELGRQFVDLDEEVESLAGCAISEIFRRRGETEFRALEIQALRDLRAPNPLVVATGGGVLSRAGARRVMSERGVTVWIDVPFEVLAQRLAETEPSSRPMFRDENQARELWESRLPDYERADMRVRLRGSETPPEVARSIKKKLEGKTCGT